MRHPKLFLLGICFLVLAGFSFVPLLTVLQKAPYSKLTKIVLAIIILLWGLCALFIFLSDMH